MRIPELARHSHTLSLHFLVRKSDAGQIDLALVNVSVS